MGPIFSGMRRQLSSSLRRCLVLLIFIWRERRIKKYAGKQTIDGQSRSIEDALGSLRDQKHRRRRYLGRWPVHGQLQHRGWYCLQDCVALVLRSVASPRTSSVPRVALCPRLTRAETKDCCEYSAGEYNITVSGKPGAISSSGEFREVVRESFDVVGRSTGSTGDYHTGRISRKMTPLMRRASRYSRPVLLLPLLDLAKSPSLVICGRSLSTLVPSDEYRLVIHDSSSDGMCCGYGDGSALLYCDQDGSLHSRTV
jgi:hypothetical protein